MNTYQIANKKIGKIPFLMWMFCILTMVAFAIVGFYQRELLAYITLSFFPVGTIFIISIVFAYFTNNDSILIARAVWVILSIFLIVFVSFFADINQPNVLKETGLVVGYSMGILSFPSSVLFFLLFAGFCYLINGHAGPNLGFLNSYYWNIFIFWVGFFIGGYFQWFKLIPYMINRFRKNKTIT
jgi:hypothetical protein